MIFNVLTMLVAIAYVAFLMAYRIEYGVVDSIVAIMLGVFAMFYVAGMIAIMKDYLNREKRFKKR